MTVIRLNWKKDLLILNGREYVALETLEDKGIRVDLNEEEKTK